MAIPGDFKYLYMPFDEIIPSIIENRVDAGVIIHESRFTYQEVGLHCILDLGEWWEDETGCLIPLGGIIASNGLDRKIRLETRRLIRGSIEFAEEHPEEARGYILENAQELDEEIVDSHIGLYVNEYSKDLGDEGRRAIEQLYRRSRALGLLPETGWNGDHQFFSP
jgi:1,4-dihydroxy-6-naphthoate synthase